MAVELSNLPGSVRDSLAREAFPKEIANALENYKDLALEILSQDYMRLLNFKEGNPPFAEPTLKLLNKHVQVIETSQQVIRQTVARDSSCQCYDSLSDDKKDLILVAGLIILIFLLYFPFDRYLSSYPGLLDFITSLKIIVPALTVLLRSYSVRDTRKEKTATTLKEKAQEDLRASLAILKETLEKQKEAILELAKSLIIDHKDGAPFLHLTVHEQGGELNRFLPSQRERMKFKAAFIEHFVAQFSKKYIFIIKAMNAVIRIQLEELENLTPQNLLEQFVAAANTICDTTIKGANISKMADFSRQKDSEQMQFLKVTFTVNSDRSKNNSLHLTPMQVDTTQKFPESCGSKYRSNEEKKNAPRKGSQLRT